MNSVEQEARGTQVGETAEGLPTAARVWREYESAVAVLANSLIGAIQARRVFLDAMRKASQHNLTVGPGEPLEELKSAERDALLERDMADARVEVDRERVQSWRALLAYLTAQGGGAVGEGHGYEHGGIIETELLRACQALLDYVYSQSLTGLRREPDATLRALMKEGGVSPRAKAEYRAILRARVAIAKARSEQP